MADGTDDHDEFDSGLDGVGDPDTEGIHEDPPSYHSGRVRIIGAEPAGDAVREVTGPVVEEHPELPHWNDAPTGQVPAVLDTQHRGGARRPAHVARGGHRLGGPGGGLRAVHALRGPARRGCAAG